MIRECIRGCRGFPGVILLTNLAHATSLRSSRVGIPALANALAYGREGNSESVSVSSNVEQPAHRLV